MNAFEAASRIEAEAMKVLTPFLENVSRLEVKEEIHTQLQQRFAA